MDPDEGSDQEPDPRVKDAVKDSSNIYTYREGRPQVLIKKGQWDNDNAILDHPANDDDWHQPGDIIWFSFKFTVLWDRGHNTWTMRARPSSVVRMGRIAVSSS